MTDHYARLDGLFAELGEADGLYCPGNVDFVGWYNSQTGGAPPWDGRARPWALPKEYPTMRKEVDRVLYSTVNYVPQDWFIHGWRAFRWGDNGRVWDGDKNPMPGYGDLRAYAPFADIDLADDVKHRRPDGDIPREMVEEALSMYLEAFADLAGGMDHVFALDSVGGAYAFVAPTATAPLADVLDADARALLFEDLTDRANEWLRDVKAEVNRRIPDAEGTFEPDLLNNKNRLYKAPMSVHSSLDGVVTPVDPSAPTYAYTPIDAVSEDLIADAEAWAESFTGDHREAVASIVATLWPDHYADAEDWRGAVRSRVEEIREAKEANERRTEQRLVASDLPDDMEETDEIDVVTATIEALDVTDVARRVCETYPGGEWDTDPGRAPTRFDPPWRTSDSGTSCYADRDKYVDLEEGKKGGGALQLVARAAGLIPRSGASLRGDAYWQAVAELRKLGFDVPYFTGKDGTHPDGLRLFKDAEDTDDARRKALRAARASKRH